MVTEVVLRGRRGDGARARRGRGAARGALPRHRPDDPRLARRARQLHGRRRDRRARALERRRRRRRDEQPRASIRSGARSCTSPAGSSTASSQSNPFPPITMVPEDVELHRRARRARPHRASPRTSACSRSRSRNRARRSCVSAAASSVGSIAGQIAKMQGARVIGIAGSPEKCAWVVDELGFDACIDYKSEDVAARLKELAPQGRRHLLRQRRRRAARHRAAPPRDARAASCCAATSRPTTSTARRRRCTTSATSWASGRAWRASTPSTTGTTTTKRPRSSRAWVADGKHQAPRARARRARPRARSARPPLHRRPPRQARRQGRLTSERIRLGWHWRERISSSVGARPPRREGIRPRCIPQRAGSGGSPVETNDTVRDASPSRASAVIAVAGVRRRESRRRARRPAMPRAMARGIDEFGTTAAFYKGRVSPFTYTKGFSRHRRSFERFEQVPKPARRPTRHRHPSTTPCTSRCRSASTSR